MVGGEEAVESLRLIERLYATAKPLSENWNTRGVSV